MLQRYHRRGALFVLTVFFVFLIIILIGVFTEEEEKEIENGLTITKEGVEVDCPPLEKKKCPPQKKCPVCPKPAPTAFNMLNNNNNNNNAKPTKHHYDLPPVLLVTSGRSGSTWQHNVIASHPDIVGHQEIFLKIYQRPVPRNNHTWDEFQEKLDLLTTPKDGKIHFAKFMTNHIPTFSAELMAKLEEWFVRVRPILIWNERRDTLGRFLSMKEAFKTNVWQHYPGKEFIEEPKLTIDTKEMLEYLEKWSLENEYYKYYYSEVLGLKMTYITYTDTTRATANNDYSHFYALYEYMGVKEPRAAKLEQKDQLSKISHQTCEEKTTNWIEIVQAICNHRSPALIYDLPYLEKECNFKCDIKRSDVLQWKGLDTFIYAGENTHQFL